MGIGKLGKGLLVLHVLSILFLVFCLLNNLTSRMKTETSNLLSTRRQYKITSFKHSIKNTLINTKGKSGSLGENKVIIFNQTSWSFMDDQICAKKEDFMLGYIRIKKPKMKIPIFLHPGDKDIHISRVLLNGGSWEMQLLDKMINVMSRFSNATFIDIGAHVGVYSLTIAALGHRVIAIDCYRENIERLCASSKRRSLQGDISIVYNALSSERKILRTKKSSEFNIGSNHIVSNNTPNPKADDNYLETVQAIRLDDLIELFHVKSAVLKLDVEGHEDRVLMGAEKFFNRVEVHFILMEFHMHKENTSGHFIQKFLYEHEFVPDLPSYISLTDTAHWPYNVLWKRRNRK